MKKHFFLELNVLFFGKSDGPLRALVKPHKMMGQKRLQFLSGLVRPVSVLTCAIEINRHFWNVFKVSHSVTWPKRRHQCIDVKKVKILLSWTLQENFFLPNMYANFSRLKPTHAQQKTSLLNPEWCWACLSPEAYETHQD